MPALIRAMCRELHDETLDGTGRVPGDPTHLAATYQSPPSTVPSLTEATGASGASERHSPFPDFGFLPPKDQYDGSYFAFARTTRLPNPATISFRIF